ncbi:hypothetical protein [Sphingomonas bisphenolicum]|jgi:hypothetical protein|uniref:hypothetical protein n=1 Tax=Sphingomonas bisphenolicum TaxID=296544 RepID=UPI0011AE28B5|nr:hypothetical protein [Sphingomonas bisphenolicum]
MTHDTANTSAIERVARVVAAWMPTSMPATIRPFCSVMILRVIRNRSESQNRRLLRKAGKLCRPITAKEKP